MTLARSRIMRTSKKAMAYAGAAQVTTDKAGKMRLHGKEAAMTNKQKQARASHLFRKSNSILWVLLANRNPAWELAYSLKWDGMVKRHKQQINNK